MRFHGTLKTWKDERGFGFIQPQPGHGEIFVHISAFPRDGSRPRVGEPLSFEITTRQDGKKCAIKISRPQPTKPRRSAPAHTREQRHRPRHRGRLLGATVAIAVGVGAVQLYNIYAPAQLDGETPSRSIAGDRRPAPQRPRYQCDGRIYCSQMGSCAEARFFLANCPGVKMDGNHDEEPCERQWCN